MNTFVRLSALALCTALGVTGVTTSAHAQTSVVPFIAGSYAVQGSVTHNFLNLLTQTVQLGAVDASTTNGNGSSDNTLASAQSSAFDIPIYNLTGANDSSTACDSTTCDSANAVAAVSGIDLLGGLITVSGLNAPLSASPITSTSDPLQIQLSGNSVFYNLGGTGINIVPKIYPAGTKFPVNGNITIPLLDLAGVEIGTQQVPFTGTLILDDVLPINNSNGYLIGDDVVALHLIGSAPDALGGTYSFDIKVGGPSYQVSPDGSVRFYFTNPSSAGLLTTIEDEE
jgi:hypothetical protein